MNAEVGISEHPLYAVWSSMKSRCINQSNPAYANYGGRGIKVCERWQAASNVKHLLTTAPARFAATTFDTRGNVQVVTVNMVVIQVRFQFLSHHSLSHQSVKKFAVM